MSSIELITSRLGEELQNRIAISKTVYIIMLFQLDPK
jgi:hypothetical protein